MVISCETYKISDIPGSAIPSSDIGSKFGVDLSLKFNSVMNMLFGRYSKKKRLMLTNPWNDVSMDGISKRGY